jgi:hypothetical protein
MLGADADAMMFDADADAMMGEVGTGGISASFEYRRLSVKMVRLVTMLMVRISRSRDRTRADRTGELQAD